MIAAIKGFEKIVKLLIAQQAINVNIKDILKPTF